jgi:hypothetical protein
VCVAEDIGWSHLVRGRVSEEAPQHAAVGLDGAPGAGAVGGVFETEDDGALGSGTATSSTFKRDDVYKMHTYRDALSHVHTALAVFPGTDTGPTLYGDGELGSIGGVGAVPLAPGERYDPTVLDLALRATLPL